MRKFKLTNNLQKCLGNGMGKYSGITHENYLDVERSFYEFLKETKTNGREEKEDFTSLFMYL